MKIGSKDWVFIAVVVAVLVVVILLSGEEKTKKVPLDEPHHASYEIFKKTGSKSETEKGCDACHNDSLQPLPKGHPPKNRCLFCHKMKQTAS
jgi:hypothetical protein